MQGRDCPCTNPPATPTTTDRTMIVAALFIVAGAVISVLVYIAARALGVAP
jgi:hypothetical protein